jgi:hypothetical protein
MFTQEIPPPVLFNSWKHHAGALRQRIAAVAEEGPAALAQLPVQLLVIGTELMDLYTGALSPAEIAEDLLTQLRERSCIEPDAFRAWVDDNQGYRLLTLAKDGSRWVLRHGGESDRYVHVHPGRWSPGTHRIRATVLKTAVMVLAHAGIQGGDPVDVTLINQVRRQYLGLPPLGALASSGGLRAVIDLLR